MMLSHVTVLGWGNNAFGQLGIEESCEDDMVTIPKTVDWFKESSLPICGIVCGWNHTLYLLDSGLVYSCGLNDEGQLGYSQEDTSLPKQINALEAQFIVQASCGESHTVVLNNKGQLFSFGSNDKGQLGLGSDDTPKHIPRHIKSVNAAIVQVMCGKKHTVALSTGGNLYSWGCNMFGQLGIGSKCKKVALPQHVNSLFNCPVYQVSAGGFHTVVVTISGTVFAWGKNSSGQLGLGDNTDRIFPSKVKLLSGKSVRYVSCGEEHTAALTAHGGLYTFGAGSSGQLGHNLFSDEYNPKMVMELMGTEISQIACGRKHTLAFVTKTGRLYVFGLGAKGQLGINSLQKINSPAVISSICSCAPTHYKRNDVHLYYFESDEELLTSNLSDTNDRRLSTNECILWEVFSGGLQSFVILTDVKAQLLPRSQTIIKEGTLLFMNSKVVESLMKDFQSETANARVMKYISTIFSNPACLNGSFLKRFTHEHTTINNHGVHLMSARSSFQMLCTNPTIEKSILTTLTERLIPSLNKIPPDIEALRLYLLLPELNFFNDVTKMWQVMIPFANILFMLPLEAQRVLVRWWSSLPATFCERLITSFQSCVVALLDQKLPETPSQVIFSLHAALKSSMMILDKLNEVNNEVSSIVPFTTFYIADLVNKIDIQADYLNWIQQPTVFSFCQYPFVLDVKVKALLLQIDADLQMKAAVHETHVHNLNSLFHGNLNVPVNPLLVLQIRRSHMVQDTLTEILSHAPFELKKPLKVKFSEEVAEDAGGVKKEFFLLLMREIVDAKYGMFDFYEESQVCWFKRQSFEDPAMFMLIGIICGLAIYNSTIIEFPFPLCLYKKLLKKKITLDDYREIEPGVARNLQFMLDYSEDNFCDVFDVTFQIIETVFGDNQMIDLIQDGGNVEVNLENREQYVTSFIEYKINSSVEKEFQAFAEGFHRVCGGRVMNLFHPQELMEMVVGGQDYDFTYLEKNAEYKGEYYRQHLVIDNFWNAFYEFDLNLKKRFLAFLTGSDKVSIFGMKNMKFIIQPVAGGLDGMNLPVAHTCFNLLDLPKYPTLEIMTTKLRQAVENSEGFGLV